MISLEIQAPFFFDMAEVSLGMLIDIVDEEWMRDTLPDDGKVTILPSHITPQDRCISQCPISSQIIVGVYRRRSPIASSACC